jgi:hypothetical protein
VQVRCDEGVAIHIDPKPCVCAREGAGEASAGERIGQPLSRESQIIPGADVLIPTVTQRQVWFQRVVGFFLCFVVGFATVAALVLTGYGPPPGMFGPEDLGSAAATPGSQSSPVRTPSDPTRP